MSELRGNSLENDWLILTKANNNNFNKINRIKIRNYDGINGINSLILLK